MENSQDGNRALPIMGFQKESLVDFPGHTASVIYFGGCNLRCPYCHNRDLAELRNNRIAEELIVSYIRLMGIQYVVITGGEPGMYLKTPAMQELIRKLTSNRVLQIKMDTNGTQVLMPFPGINYVALDYKLPLRRYMEIPGITDEGLTLLKSNLRIGTLTLVKDLNNVASSHFELRTTVHKRLLSEDDLKEMKDDLVMLNNTCLAPCSMDEFMPALLGSWYLQQYRKCDGFDSELQDCETYSDEELTELAISVGAVVRGVPDTLVEKSVSSVLEKLKKYEITSGLSTLGHLRLLKHL